MRIIRSALTKISGVSLLYESLTHFLLFGCSKLKKAKVPKDYDQSVNFYLEGFNGSEIDYD